MVLNSQNEGTLEFSGAETMGVDDWVGSNGEEVFGAFFSDF